MLASVHTDNAMCGQCRYIAADSEQRSTAATKHHHAQPQLIQLLGCASTFVPNYLSKQLSCNHRLRTGICVCIHHTVAFGVQTYIYIHL